MQRRDFFKGIMAASVAATAVPNSLLAQQTATPVAPSAPPPATPPPGPVPWMRGLMEVKPLPITTLSADAVAQTNAHFFSDQQLATLRRLSEVLVPPSQGYPGSIEAGAPEFLDFLVGVSPSDRQQLYQSGLDRLEAEAKKHFTISFTAANADQADQLLRPWLRTWMNDHPPTDPYEQFINIAHADIRTATINSQAWSDAARKAGTPTPNTDLYWYPVDPDLHHDSSAYSQLPATHPRPS
jgi:Gluconate 2-dehydrogenase subunit 3